MARKNRKIVITNNKEIYNKFNMLHFSKEVILKDVKKVQVERIVNNFNKDRVVLQIEKIGDYFLVRKTKTVNFSVYLK